MAAIEQDGRLFEVRNDFSVITPVSYAAGFNFGMRPPFQIASFKDRQAG